MQNKNITVTNIIIALTVVGYVIQINIAYGSIYMGLNRYFLDSAFYWQPLSTIFAHGGIGHLGMNMFVLYQFGNAIERVKGVKFFLFLYIFGGVLTSLGSFAFMHGIGFGHNLIGASGAICLLMGYIAFVNKRERKGIITWVLIISVAPILIGLPIAWYAHFIGLAIGFIMGRVMR